MTEFTIEHAHSSELTPTLAADIKELCDAAYREDTQGYFAALGPGDHLVGRVGDRVVTHLMWVTRWLEPQGKPQLRTAYIEMVATHPDHERRGHASALLRKAESMVQDFDVAALCPATDSLYERLGWRFWRGPLFTRRGAGLEATPEERVMLLPTARTPDLDWSAPLSIEWRPGEVW